jgi:hypothetical protein
VLTPLLLGVLQPCHHMLPLLLLGAPLPGKSHRAPGSIRLGMAASKGVSFGGLLMHHLLGAAMQVLLL